MLPPGFWGHCRAGTGNAELHMLGGVLRVLQIKVHIIQCILMQTFSFVFLLKVFGFKA